MARMSKRISNKISKAKQEQQPPVVLTGHCFPYVAYIISTMITILHAIVFFKMRAYRLDGSTASPL